MKKQYILLALVLVIVLITGCRKSQSDEKMINTNKGDTVQGGAVTTGTQELPHNDLGLGALISGKKIEVAQKDSFVNTEFSYEDIKEVDVDNWSEYLNENYQLAFSFPTDYVVFEDGDGDITVTAEGAGDFFYIFVGGKGARNTPIRRSTVTINSHEFTIDERKEDGTFEVSYYTTINGQEYRFLYLFNQEDEYLDLFNRIMQTVRFF